MIARAIWSVIAILFCLGSAGLGSDISEARMLYDFKTDQTPWITVNDNVMGGVSVGGSRFTEDDLLEFAGNLSLENNGGFSSIRSPQRKEGFGGFTGLALRIRGDGRQYYVNLHTTSRMTAGAWRATLPSVRGQWKEARIPFSSFAWTLFGRRVPAAALNPAAIRSIGFTIADKKAGPFKLEVDWIKAYGSAEQQKPNLVEIIRSEKGLTLFLKAVEAAGLEGALQRETPLTVFAPSDDAFQKLPEGSLDALLQKENRSRLAGLLLGHVLPGRVRLGTRESKGLSGNEIAVKVEGPLRAGGARVRKPDIVAANGVLHVIDEVLSVSQAAPGTSVEAIAIIRDAIELGVPLFNAGNPEICAAIYDTAAHRILRSTIKSLGADLRADVEDACRRSRTEADAVRRAWILRRALDAMAQGLEP